MTWLGGRFQSLAQRIPSKRHAAALRVDPQHGVDAGTVQEVDVPLGVDAVDVAAVAERGVVATGVEPRDPAGGGRVDHRVERARAIARPVVRSAERPGDDVHAVGHEPVDGGLGLRRCGRSRQEQLGARSHVLDDLGDGDAVPVAGR